MPGDPLAPVSAGDPLPNRAETFNQVFEAARAFRAKKRNGPVVQPPKPGAYTPAHIITVVNSTGVDLPLFSVVELTDTLESLTDDYLVISDRPAIEGIVPTATTAPFAILLDGVVDGGVVSAVVGGCAVVDVDITDAAHEYATPKVGETDYLTSAATGPVRIIDRETGSSGVKRACVMVVQSVGAVSLTVKESDGTPSYANIASLEFDEADFTVTQPGSGRAKIQAVGGGGGASSQYITPGSTTTISAANTYYDIAGTSFTLAAGTHHLTADILWKYTQGTPSSTSYCVVDLELYDVTNSTTYDGSRAGGCSCEFVQQTTPFSIVIPLTTSTSFKFRVRLTIAGSGATFTSGQVTYAPIAIHEIL